MIKMLKITSVIMTAIGLFAVVIMAILLGANLTLSVVTGVYTPDGYAVLSSCFLMVSFIMLLACGIAGNVYFHSGSIFPGFVMGWATLGVDVLAIVLGILFVDLSVQLVIIYEMITVLPVLFIIPCAVIKARSGKINSERDKQSDSHE